MPNEQLDTIRKDLAENPIFPADANLDQIREIFDNMGNSLPQTGNISDTVISEQKFRGMWVEVKDTQPQRAILYIHGGGFVTGSPKSHHELMSRLAVSANAKVLGLDYRRVGWIASLFWMSLISLPPCCKRPELFRSTPDG